MQTVVETPAYLASAADEGLDEIDRAEIVRVIASDPTAGVIIAGSGGARKIRIAGRGKGKSGGYRVITFYTGENLPVFLLDIYGKGGKANLTKTELNELREILIEMPRVYRDGVAARLMAQARTVK